MTVWFTADLHFGHKRMLDWRPFPDLETMHAEMIEQWRKHVKPTDVVFVLGDVFWKSRIAIELAPQLTGRLMLVRGNHDSWPITETPFRDLGHYYEFTAVGEGKRRVVLSHYPFMTWNRAHHGAWHFHGHSHGNLTAQVTTREDVGVDATVKWVGSYRPVAWEELRERMKPRHYLPRDHHIVRPT